MDEQVKPLFKIVSWHRPVLLALQHCLQGISVLWARCKPWDPEEVLSPMWLVDHRTLVGLRTAVFMKHAQGVFGYDWKTSIAGPGLSSAIHLLDGIKVRCKNLQALRHAAQVNVTRKLTQPLSKQACTRKSAVSLPSNLNRQNAMAETINFSCSLTPTDHYL